MPTRYLPEPAPVVTPDRLITRPWALLVERLIGDVVVAGTGAAWGSITGSLAAQADLVAALAAAAGGGLTYADLATPPAATALGALGTPYAHLALEGGVDVFGDGSRYGVFADFTGTDTANHVVTGLYLTARTLGVGLTQDLASVGGVLAGVESRVPVGRTLSRGTGGNFQFVHQGAGTTALGQGTYTQVDVEDGHVDALAAATLYCYSSGGTIDRYYGLYLQGQISGAAVTDFSAIWMPDFTGFATNAYAFWSDSPGGYRIKHDGVMAYYNPTFTKYTPGAVNFERVRQEWIGDVATYGPEAGGTGVLRALNLVGSDVQANGVSLLGGGATGELLAWVGL